MDDAQADVDTGLIDLTGVPVSELIRLDDTVLTHCLRRVVWEVTHGSDGAVAAFDSSI